MIGFSFFTEVYRANGDRSTLFVYLAARLGSPRFPSGMRLSPSTFAEGRDSRLPCLCRWHLKRYSWGGDSSKRASALRGKPTPKRTLR